MPLLTHEETGTESVARTQAVALAERPPAPARRNTGRGGWRGVRRALYVLLGLAILGPLLAFVIGWFIFPVPTSEQVTLDQVSRYTFADGSDLAVDRGPDGVNREVVRLDAIPMHVREAVLAAENRDFYSDPGFDVTGIMRAVYNQLTGGVGGGSTITQQYVKVVTGDDDISLIRKYKEIVLAVKITREQTKDEILENYLNTIYMGRSAYGVQAASQAFFAKDVGQLTVSEGAMLAGIIQAPSRHDPAEDPAGSQNRWTFVMDQMAGADFLTPAERSAEAFPTTWLPEAPPVEGVPGDDRGHIYDRVKTEVLARGIVTEEQFATEGLTITTTIDPARQRAAVDAVTGELEGQPEMLRGSLVSIDPRTGAVVSYYGGQTWPGTDYANAPRPAGSSYKPFVLAAAMEADPEIGLGTNYDGSSPQQFPGSPRPVSNNEGFDCARCSVETAMTRSINTIFYQMGLDAGPQKVIEMAHRLGIPEQFATEARGGIALGDQDVPQISMASAYATLAADGVYREPYFVASVTAADGRVLYERAEDPGEQALEPQIARNVTEAMLDVADVSDNNLDGRPEASKTGTQQAPVEGENKDAWMVGFTPSLATAVWIGSDNSDPIQTASGRPIFGSTLPGPIWKQYMDAALEGTTEEEFSDFEPLGRAPVSEAAASSNRTDDRPRPSAPPTSEDQEGDGDDNGDGENGDENDDGGDDNDNGNGEPNDDGGLFGGDNDNNGDNGGDDNGDNGGDNNGDNNDGDNGDGDGDNE